MRFLTSFIANDLKKKMVFLGGPRQCGKTTLAKSLLKGDPSGLYLNWDRVQDKKAILNGTWSDQNGLIIFDEVHKYSKWKNLIKGFYDTEKDLHQFLVTGSARLNIYKRGGDSLLGRYHHWRMHPFTLFDHPANIKRTEALERLMKVGGFPEVFLDNDPREARRWREERSRLIVREDIRDVEQLQNLDQLELLVEHLRGRVGSTLSMSSLGQEIGVSPATIVKWLGVLEKMYVTFAIHGYDKKITRAVHKPVKVYFYDNADVQGDEGVRFENLVATHLLQKNNFLEDYHGYKMGLYYIRDKNQREVDFLVTQDGKPTELLEAKLKDQAPSKNLISFAELLKANAAIQLTLDPKISWTKGRLKMLSALDFFTDLAKTP